MNGKMAFRLAVFSLVLAGLSLALGCQAPMQKKDTVSAWKPAKVVVLPFQAVTPKEGEGEMVRSPLSSSVFSARGGRVGTAGLAQLDQALADSLYSTATFKVVPASQGGMVFGRLLRDNLGKPLLDAITETGKRLQAEAVLVGHLYRFAQRVGGDYAVKSPASVAFDLALIRVGDGVVIWKNSFDQTQRSLSEDLFNIDQFVEHGLRWYTAEELAGYGMANILRRFPWRKLPISTEE